jgi:hypothetical protein
LLDIIYTILAIIGIEDLRREVFEDFEVEELIL